MHNYVFFAMCIMPRSLSMRIIFEYVKMDPKIELFPMHKFPNGNKLDTSVVYCIFQNNKLFRGHLLATSDLFGFYIYIFDYLFLRSSFR